MVSKLYELFFSPTGRSAATVFTGNLISALLGFIALTLISRSLGPEGFGNFSILTAIIVILAGITDFGIGSAFVNKYSSTKDPSTKKSLVSLIIKAELLIGVLIIALGFLITPIISDWLSIKDPSAEFLVRISFIGAAFTSTNAIVFMILQARKRFLTYSLINIFLSSFKLLAVVVLLLVGILGLYNSIIVYSLAPIFGLVLGLTLVRPIFIKFKDSRESALAVEMFHFSKWVMLSFLATAISGRLELFIIQFFKGSHDVGIYSAAFQFALGFSLLFAAISTVFLPRLSEIKGKENFIKSAKKVFQASSVLAVASLPLFFLSGTLMNFFFGDKYIESASIFNVLLIGYVLALYTAPISVYFYAWRKPKVLTGLNYIQLLVALTLNLLLVPKFGAVGGAFAWLASSLIGIPYLIYFFVKHLYTMEK